MYSIHWWILLVLVLMTARSNLSQALRESLISQPSTQEYIMRIQCQAKCLMSPTKLCHEQCLVDLKFGKKCGTCPRRNLTTGTASNNATTWMEDNCIDTCSNWDYNCPEAEKCCPTACGSVCQRPSDVDRIKVLPPMPKYLSLMESQSRKVELCWNLLSNKNKTVFFVIEGRSHPGSVFAPHKLNDWSIFEGQPRYDHVYWDRQREIARRCCFIHKVKPGRWYQFRVASLNENGTRGFSEPSGEIQLKEHKGHKLAKPPRNLTIGPLYFDRHTTRLLTTKVSWGQPKTSIPVNKYKIFWSRHLSGTIDSLAMEQATVYEPQRHYEIRHLIPDSSYYIQVMAISIFGRKRLKSKKESRFLNTTLSAVITQPAESPPLNDRPYQHRDNNLSSSIRRRFSDFGSPPRSGSHILIRFIATKSNKLLVRINWPNVYNHANFQLELCQGTEMCLGRIDQGEYRTVNTTRNRFEFLDLKYRTQYTVRLKSIPLRHHHHQHLEQQFNSTRTFTIPGCKRLKLQKSTESLECI